MIRKLVFCFCIALLACSHRERRSLHTGSKEIDHTLAIVPFKGIDAEIVKEIKSALEQKLLLRITILDQQVLPVDAFYKPRGRYIADSLLNYLGKIAKERFEKIIGITSSDISTKKEPYNNWGVMGLGYCPGKACVISSFRIKTSATDHKHYINRMIVLAMHELGHTYSLPHCPHSNCIMKDAEGKMNLDNGNTYCYDCSSQLKKEGILK